MINLRKSMLFILTVILLIAVCPTAAHAEDDWATFTSDPVGGSTLRQGDMIAYTIILQSESDEEQMLRIQVPNGVTLSENAFVYRPVDEERSDCSVIWGNDGCVITLPRLSRGDVLIFVAQVANVQSPAVTCTVTCNEKALAISHNYLAPTPTPTQSKPELINASPTTSFSVPNSSAMQESVNDPNRSANFVENRQVIVLLICTLLLSVSSVGLIIAIRQYVRLQKGEHRSQESEEETL